MLLEFKKKIMLRETLVMVYYAYFHWIMDFVVILGGNSHYNINFFRLQKSNKHNYRF